MTPPDIPAALAEWLRDFFRRQLNEAFPSWTLNAGILPAVTHDEAARLHAAIEKGRDAEEREMISAYDPNCHNAFWTALLAALREGK